MREEIQRIRIVFQSPLIPLFGLYPSSSTFPKRERKRKVYLLGRRAYYHVYCKTFVTLQSPKAPPEFIPQSGRGVESLSRSDSYRKREGLPNRFRAASHFFFLQRVETRLLPNRSWLRRSCVDTVQPLPRGLTGEGGVFETLSKLQNVVRLLNVSLMK